MNSKNKKSAAPGDPKGITIRLLPAELEAVESDIVAIASLGGPRSSVNAYCKHGALSYARLRRVEAKVRAILVDGKLTIAEREIARAILEAASS